MEVASQHRTTVPNTNRTENPSKDALQKAENFRPDRPDLFLLTLLKFQTLLTPAQKIIPTKTTTFSESPLCKLSVGIPGIPLIKFLHWSNWPKMRK